MLEVQTLVGDAVEETDGNAGAEYKAAARLKRINARRRSRTHKDGSATSTRRRGRDGSKTTTRDVIGRGQEPMEPTMEPQGNREGNIVTKSPAEAAAAMEGAAAQRWMQSVHGFAL